MARQVLKAEKISFLEIMACFFMGDLMDAYPIDYEGLSKQISDIKITSTRKNVFDRIMNDAKQYQLALKAVTKIQDVNSQSEIDALYIRIFVSHYTRKLGIQSSIQSGKFNKVIQFFGFDARQADRIVQKIMPDYLNSIVFSDLKPLSECMELLENKVSSSCRQFIKCSSIQEVAGLGSAFNFELTKDFYEKLRNIQEKIEGIGSRKQVDNAETLSLFLLLQLTLAKAQFMRAVAKPKSEETVLSEKILQVYEVYKPLYFAMLNAQTVLERLNSFGDDPVTAVIDNLGSLNFGVVIKKRLEVKQKQEPIKKIVKKTDPVDASLIAPVQPPSDEQVVTMPPEKKSEKKPKPAPTPRESKKKVLKPSPLELKRQAVLKNVKVKHKEILFQIFDSKYKNIGLRDLVEVARAFGANISTTGRNRCRIELNNIYTNVMLSSSVVLSRAESATITFHGGGHRSRRSHNRDRGIAPTYLVEQFRAAFERANCTPALLWPELSSAEKQGLSAC